MAKLSEKECEQLLVKKDKLLEEYDKLLKDKKFVNIITSGTAAIDNVKGRHNTIYKIFRKVLADD